MYLTGEKLKMCLGRLSHYGADDWKGSLWICSTQRSAVRDNFPNGLGEAAIEQLLHNTARSMIPSRRLLLGISRHVPGLALHCSCCYREGADCQLVDFPETEWLKREILGFWVFFLCLGNFQEKFQGQIIDLHLWFLSRCFMHRPSLLPKGVKMPRELNLTEEMPRDEIQRKDTSTCHQVVLLDLFREKFLLCKSQHTHNTAKIQAWPGKWIGQIWTLLRVVSNSPAAALQAGTRVLISSETQSLNTLSTAHWSKTLGKLYLCHEREPV